PLIRRAAGGQQIRGLDLTLHLSGADVVVLVDALHGVAPGTLAIYAAPALCAGSQGARLETHSPASQESILIARLSGGQPRDVRLIGLAGASFEYGTALTPAVRARIPSLIDAVLAQLTQLKVAWA